jgi:hypothetical protein
MSGSRAEAPAQIGKSPGQAAFKKTVIVRTNPYAVWEPRGKPGYMAPNPAWLSIDISA